MRKLTIDVDEGTYANWVQRAAAHGLHVAEWLKVLAETDSPNGRLAEQPIEELTPAERRARLREFEATLVGYGGTAEFDREQLYD